MSNLATAPRRAPATAPAPTRHLEIAPSRAQRRARPRLVHVVVVLGGIGAILLGQLLLSIWIADGAYQVHSLQSEQTSLQRQQRALDEQLDQLSSPQSVAAKAEQLGMVASGNPAYLDLGTGAVTGTPSAGTTGVVGGTGDLVPNSLVPATDPDLTSAANPSSTPASGASSSANAAPDDSVIASPSTH